MFGHIAAQPVFSVSCRLANQMVAVHRYADRTEIVHDNTVATCHTRLLDCDQVSYDWQHYFPVIEKKPGALHNGAPFAELPAPLLQLQTALRRRERQQVDRIMAKVLSPINAWTGSWCWNPVCPVPSMSPMY